MLYLLKALSAWSLAAAAIGLVVGASTCAAKRLEGERPDPRAAWPFLAIFLYVLGVAAALLKLLPGRAGLWLEAALLLGAAYLIGCVLGCLLRSLVFGRLFLGRPAQAPPVSGGPEAPAATVTFPGGLAEAAGSAAQLALAPETFSRTTLANDNVDAVKGAELQAHEAPSLSEDLAEGAKTIADHAGALAEATPAALAASSEAHKLLSGDTVEDAAAKAETSATGVAQQLATSEPSADDAVIAEAPAIAAHAHSGALAEAVETIVDHAGALAMATPAALAASSDARKLLSGDAVEDLAPKAEALAKVTQSPPGELAEAVETIADHAGALATATPAALAASSEAQKVLSGDAREPAAVKPDAPAPTHAPSGELVEGEKTIDDHAEALVTATPVALAAAGAAQKLLSGEQSAGAAGKAEALAPLPAVSGELADGAESIAGHAEALAAATPAALAASSAAQALYPRREALALSPPPTMQRPRREKDEDKLWQIEGVGKKLHRRLNDLGIWRFEQIARWTPEQAAWVGEKFGAPGRVESEQWILQARLLAQKTWPRSVDAAGASADGREAPPAEARPEQGEDEDDLQLVRGIGDKIVRELHDLGIWRLRQIATWTPGQQAWIGERLGHGGPEERKFWVAQAQLLVAGVETDHSRALRQGQGSASAHGSDAEPLDEAAAAALHAALPQVIAPHANDEVYAGARPLSLLQPPHGEKDDLAAIDGIDDELAERLHGLGVWTFGQIACWSDENAGWIGSYLAFPHRVQREGWVEQARVLFAKK
jgi:predicted flap endonuclease-1-like 5' DNA nuclease